MLSTIIRMITTAWLFFMIIASATPATAQTARLGDLTFENAWLRATPPNATVAAGYVMITNVGSSADRLIGVAAPFANKNEIHEMAMSGGVMQMRELPQGILVQPGAQVVLKPGGLHFMFMHLQEPLLAGQIWPVTLIFEKAGATALNMQVKEQAGGHNH